MNLGRTTPGGARVALALGMAGGLVALGVTLALAAVLALTPAAGVAPAFAQAGPASATPTGDPCQGPGGWLTPADREAMRAIAFERLRERLGLSDAQAEQIRAARQAGREARRQEAQALCQARHDLRALLAAPDADPGALLAAGDRVKAARARLLDLRLAAHLELRALLTPEQWAAWLELKKESRRGHWHRRSFAF